MVSVEGVSFGTRTVAPGFLKERFLALLYLVYTNNLPLYPGVSLSLFADACRFHYSTLSPGLEFVMLQCQLDLFLGRLRR